MKNYLFALLSVLLPSILFAQTARVQVIHNSADAAAEYVDVYLDGTLLLDSFQFRTATPFIDAPAGMPIQVGVAPANSTSANDTIANFNYTLTANETYVLVADGIVSTSGYSPATPFDIKVYGMGQESAAMMGNTDVLVHHGATDAPAVDVYESSVPAGNILTNAAYGDFSSYIPLTTADYRLQVRPTGSSTAVASYEAPLSTLNLQDSAIVVLASGFLNPANNSNGPAFGLWVALPTGGPLVALPASEARVQVIHNSPDAAAEYVDVYLNGNVLLDSFQFRTASPFVNAPAGVPVEIAVAPANSASVADSLAQFNYVLNADNKYIIVADGTLGSGFTPTQGFDLNVYNMAREMANNASEVDVLVHHGSTDAPTVDVRAVDTSTILVDDASYGDFAGYLNLMNQDYVIRITDAAGTTVVESYQAPLNTLNLVGSAITVVASGFLDPAQNNSGPAFGLWVATATGGNLIPLPLAVTSVNTINAIEGIEVSIAPNPVVSDELRLNIDG